ncbi:MAG: hypothetical protein ACYDAG_13245, partial [Chloroflexota bacterium]
MPLYGLLPLLQQSPAFQRLLESLKASNASPDSAASAPSTLSRRAGEGWGEGAPLVVEAGGVPTAAYPYLLAALQVGLRRPVVAVLPDADRAAAVYDELRAWSLEPASTLLFPPLEGLPYDEGTSKPETIRQRAAVLAELKLAGGQEPGAGGVETRDAGRGTRDTGRPMAGRWFKPLVVTSAGALFPRVTPPEQFGGKVFTLRKGQKIALEGLLEEWLRMGFQPAPLVEEPGSFTRRGGIVDVFPPAYVKPVRIELWGDEVESIRSFDPETQLSDTQVESLTFTPVREVPAGVAQRAGELFDSLDFDGCREEEAGRWRQALEAIAQRQTAEDADFYARFLFQRPASLLDYLPEDGVVVLFEEPAVARHLAGLANQAEESRAELTREGDLPANLPCPYLAWPEI